MTTAPASQLASVVEPFLDHAARSDTRAAARLVLGLLDQGATAEAVIVDVLAAAQQESGARWQRNDWTIADEHVVSGVTQRSLDAVANSAPPLPVAGSVVVACAEGDWHSLPAQMCAEVLRSRGLEVSFLGASTPASHIARLLARDRPDALVVTCNLALYFDGMARTVEAAHGAGVPVIAGGRALRDSPHRALRLGADGWAPDLPAVVDTILEWTVDGPAPRREPVRLNPVASRLALESGRISAEAFAVLRPAFSEARPLSAEQEARTREDLEYIVQFVAAALIVDDPTVLSDFLSWLTSVLGARHVPVRALLTGIDALVPLVGDVDAEAGALLALLAPSP